MSHTGRVWGIGWREIEKITLDDWVLSRDEFNPDGVAEWKPVEELFERLGRVWELEVEGRSILTTGEHPFYEKTKGWLDAMDLQVGDELLTLETTWHKVTKIEDTHTYQRVYNLSVADWHTYFVGDEGWAWSLWAHNATKPYTVVKAKKHGMAREKLVVAELKKKYPGAKIQQERYLRNAKGKSVRDKSTQERRRLDVVVIKDKKVLDVVEVTSVHAPKKVQTAKEARIRKQGGYYIRDKDTKEVLKTPKSRVVRVDLSTKTIYGL